jgi:hypothetical protein
MRLAIPFLILSALVVTGSALAQPSGAAKSGTVALSPNNCGTPDEPKACPGTKGASKHYTTHKAAAKTPQ